MEDGEDAGARTRLEAQLGRRLQAILDNSTDWIWEMTLPDFRHTYSNNRLQAILGYAPDELREIDFVELMHPDDQAVVGERLPKLIEERAGWHGWIIRARAKDGSYRYLESNASPVLDDDGRVVGFQGVDRDVTERVETERRIRHAQKIQAIGQLAGGIAHDFNNILTVILAEATLLRLALDHAEAAPELVEHAESVARAASQASELTGQLLSFSQQGSGEVELVDVAHALRRVESMLQRLVGEQILLRVDSPSQVVAVRLPDGQFEQVLLNLVVNARDAIATNGSIEIRLTRVEHEAVLTVTDTGAGMDPHTRERIFEPFYTTKAPGEGTGLGLATVHGIVVGGAGSIAVTSELEQGTKFEVRFPIAHGEVPSRRVEREPEPEPVRPGAHIVVCEDDPAVRVITRKILERAGYVVIPLPDPESVLAHARGDAPIDLLVSDVVMPGMTGLELRRALRELRPGVPVVLVSGYSADAIRQDSGAEPPPPVLQKPYEPRVLVEHVREALLAASARE